MSESEPSIESDSAASHDVLRRSSRLSIPADVRIPICSITSFGAGMTLGLLQGSQTAGLRFRAEHAHKLPTTTTGWYLYHKSKNYHVAYGGIREGLRMGAKVCFWSTAVFGIENMFDTYRGTADFVNTVIASLTVAGAFSLWSLSAFSISVSSSSPSVSSCSPCHQSLIAKSIAPNMATVPKSSF